MLSSLFLRAPPEVVASFLPVWGKERGKKGRERGRRQDGVEERQYREGGEKGTGERDERKDGKEDGRKGGERQRERGRGE